MTMLKVDNLHAYYGKSHVLHGVQFDVGPGEIVALLGRNGSGRSTTAKAIMGMVDAPARHWKGQEILGRKPTRSRTWASATCPRTATSSRKLTVHQNLMLGQKSARPKNARWSFDDMYGCSRA
jgi:branched-chain amino acid transport system ATP-binding protein